MKIFRKEKPESNRRVIYFCGIRILSYRKKNKTIIDKHKIEVLRENTCLKDKAVKKKCFLLATGASIKSQDLSMLEGEDCFSISNIFLHKDIDIIKPKLHFFAPYHEPLILENYIDWMNLADSKLPKETNIVLGYSNENLVKEYNLFPHRKIYYLDLQKVSEIQTDIEQPVLVPQTGPIMMLPVLDYIGYKSIYLVGMDMNRLANYQGLTSNFYENDPRKNATDGAGWADIITELKRTCVMFEQFEAYNKYFESKGKKIYNLSPISWLSFIEKRDFNNVLKGEL